MNQDEKIRAALTVLETSYTEMEEHEKAAEMAQKKVDNATEDAIRVLRSVGLDRIFFKGNFYTLEQDPEKDEGDFDLDITEYKGKVL